MNLTEIEQDFLGDLAMDSHGIWEVFELIRGRGSERSDSEIFRIGRNLLQAWVERDWVALSASPLHPTTVRSLSEALRTIDELGPLATRYFEGAPSIDLTDRARNDVPWLSGAG